MMLINPYILGGGVPTPAGAVGFWRGENNANDQLGAYNATVGANTAFTTGHLGQAFLLDGTNASKITVPTINAGGTYSIELWVYRTSTVTTARHLVSNAYTSASNYGALYVDSNHAVVYYRNGVSTVVTAANVIPVNTWVKVLLTYDGSKSRIWINDLPLVSEVSTHTETWNNACCFGQAVSNESAAWVGRLDEIVLYNTVVRPINGLFLHYAGENNTNDTMGRLNATAGAGTSYATGQSGQGFSFSGTSNQAVTIPSIFLDNVYSIDFQMKPSGASGGFVHTISNSWSSSNYGALYYDSGNKLVYYQGSSARATSANSVITSGSWNRVTITYDGSKTRLYVNGTLVATESGTHSETYNNQCKIGYGGESNTFSGVIDEVKFYNTLILP